MEIDENGYKTAALMVSDHGLIYGDINWLRRVLAAYEAGKQSYKHLETITHHCKRCGRNWKIEHDKDVPTTFIDCGCPTQNSLKEDESNPRAVLTFLNSGDILSANGESMGERFGHKFEKHKNTEEK